MSKNKPVTTICYGQKEVWEHREDAMASFLDGMRYCEGPERDRYTNVYIKLLDGKDVCSDEREW